MESSGLETAYAAFLEMAGSGPFTAPADPQRWTAELNVAHMVVIDHLLAATISELMAGRAPSHDNRPSIRDAHLREIVAAARDMPTLLALARHSSAVVCALVRAVDAETAERPFPILLQSGETVVLDTTVSLTTLVDAQTRLHIPGHTRAIEALKA